MLFIRPCTPSACLGFFSHFYSFHVFCFIFMVGARVLRRCNRKQMMFAADQGIFSAGLYFFVCVVCIDSPPSLLL